MKNESKPKFNPTPEMISATKSLLMAKAFVQTIRPVVEAYQKEILEKHQFTNKREIEMLTKRGIECEEKVVLSTKNLIDLGVEDLNTYFRECKIARDKAGLKVKRDDYCPLLVAESMETKTENLLIDVMEPITKINRDMLWDSKHREKLLDLTLNLMVKYCSKNGIDLKGGF